MIYRASGNFRENFYMKKIQIGQKTKKSILRINPNQGRTCPISHGEQNHGRARPSDLTPARIEIHQRRLHVETIQK